MAPIITFSTEIAKKWDLGYLNSLRWLEIAWMMDLASQGRAFMYTTLNLAREKAKYFP